MKYFRGAITGPPASGKGTIASKIVKKFDVVHVSTGDIFRKNIAEGTKWGESVQKYMLAGKLVPDVLVLRIVMETLQTLQDRNWLCDGFPRTLVQAQKMFMTYPLDLVINLNVPADVLLNRTEGRRVHVRSGRVYHTKFNPPKRPDVDDITGEPLIHRSDDRKEAVLERLKIYQETVEPMLEFYEKKGVLKRFDGDNSENFWPPIEKVILKYLQPKS